jgi:signal peptide peptidase SppA
MNAFETYSALLRGSWLIDKGFADAHLPFVKNILTRGAEVNLSAEFNKPAEMMFSVVNAQTFNVTNYGSASGAPEGSIAVLDIDGPILKNGGMCSYGSSQFTQFVKQADASPNIKGIILKIDSPGGMVDGTNTLADAIKATKKPVVAFVSDGMMASAAMWIGSAADEIYASQKTDTIGSIGVFTTLYDFREYFAKEGIKIHEIYAPQSTDKNKDYKDAMDGKYAGLKDRLKFIADEFISTVESNRGDKLKDKKEPFTGKMYSAEQATEIGLIDGIMSFEDVVKRVNKLALESQKEEFYI